jgi:hypothetical protein
MYGWGSDTTSWKGPKKYEYDSARSPYLDKLGSSSKAKGPRSYMSRSSPDMDLVNPRGKNITSDSENPIILGVDVTGSMATWPAEIFDRLPLFYQTLSQYRKDVEISFAAIGDAYCDSYPIQVTDFTKELDLEKKLNALCPEGGGGGQVSETYELFGHFLLNHCETPNAKTPFLFLFGDEKFYDTVNPDQIEHYIGDKVQSAPNSNEVWKGLMQKFNVYLLHKPYGYGDSSSVDKEVVDHWAKAIGRQRIIELPSKERAVDIAMGIVAKHWGKFSDFGDNLSARQDSSSSAPVYDSLRMIDDPSTSNHSVVTRKASGDKTTSLSEMFDDAKKP